MNELPRLARWYLYGIWLIAGLAIVTALRSVVTPVNTWFLLAVTASFTLADFFAVTIAVDDGEHVLVSVVDTLEIFLVAIVGAFGVIAVLVGSLASDLIARRPWYKGLFNGAQRSLAYLATLLVYNLVMPPGAPPFAGLYGLLAICLMVALFFVLNPAFVAGIVACMSGQPLLRIYTTALRQVQWIHFITLPAGALLAVVWAYNPWMLVAGLAPIVMAHRSFSAIASLQAESQRNKSLAREAQATSAKLERLLLERTQLFEQLRTNQEELIRSSKLAALGTFAAGIAHEFNNLLAGVHGFAELGLSSDDVVEKNEALEVALRTSKRGQSITAGLLTFARRRDSRQEPCELPILVDETLMLIERELGKANITITRDYHPIPIVNCDPGQIAQVVMNLVTNARDAMAEHGGGTITLGLCSDAEYVALSVSDTGIGIPEELRSQIFQPFLTTKGALGGSRTPGTGLGLAIIHGIVEAHGGTIQVESVVGAGTTFTLRFPASSQALEAMPPPAEKSTSPNGVHVLVVDDEAAVAESLCRRLLRQGFQAGIASSGEEALEYYRTHPVDLVLSDIIMPDMDGPELLRRLLVVNPYVLVLGMTGQPHSPLAEEMRKLGVRTVLRKPFELNDLVRAIRVYTSDKALLAAAAAPSSEQKEP